MKDLKIYVIIASVLLVFYLIGQYNRPKAIDWTKNLLNDQKNPFDTYVLYNRISDIVPGSKISTYREPVYNVINDRNIKSGTYIIIANRAELNEYDYKKLSNFIKKGNDVFIAANSFGAFLKKELKVISSYSYRTGDATRISFVSKSISTFQYAIDRNCSDGYFSELDTSKAIVLGQNEDNKPNYIKYSIGKGSLYLHACPLMFTNYSILKEQGAAYTSIALSYLNPNKNIIWDEYYSQGRVGEESLMRVFLQKTALHNAFYLALCTLLIFVFYQIKRRQRIIPIIEPLTNTTIDFVNVVGQVYYEQRDNSNIAHKKASYFLEHLRTKYSLKTNILNEEFVTSLSHKSGVDASLIRELINQITLARSSTRVTDQELIGLNKNIEQFYMQSR
jgi:hypothetical protein